MRLSLSTFSAPYGREHDTTSIPSPVSMNQFCGIYTIKSFSVSRGSLEPVCDAPSPHGSRRVTASSEDGSHGDSGEVEAVRRENSPCKN